MSEPSFQDIVFSVENQVATITLNRPNKGNSITPLMSEEILKAIDLVKDDPEVCGFLT